MSKCAIGLIAGLLAAGTLGAPAVSSAQVSSTGEAGEAMPSSTSFPSDAIVGEWCTQREENRPPGRIKFLRENDGTYVGVISWQSVPLNDVHNKDPKLNGRPLLGAVVMWHLRYEDGEYVDGYVYNPEDGGTYRMKAEVLTPESLKVRGYLGISLFGQNRTWSRFHPS
jgi:uncharacterized protein (DUF2147 family)